MISLKARLEDGGVNIDALDEGIIESFLLATSGVMKSAQAEWVRLAQNQLHTSREIYINGLRQAESFKVKGTKDNPIFELQLVGKMPNSFEFGMEAFDMKAVRPGWLGGGKAKTAKDGHKYVIIPFRHSTTSDTRLGYTGKAAAAGLKEELRKTVKEYGLNRMVRAASGAVVTGPVARVPNNAPGVHRYLRGLTRIQQASPTPPAAGRKPPGSSTLKTWRVMSENSPAGSWMHPGLEAANLLPRVEEYIDRELDNLIETMLGSV